MQDIYLDNSATTKCLPEVAQAVKKALLEQYGNPSSIHEKGVSSSEILNSCRQKAAETIAAAPEQIYFTSGGTEANNLAIYGTVERHGQKGNHIISTEIEHPSVYRPLTNLEKKGFDVTRISPDKNGLINPRDIKTSLRSDTILVSIMQVNNETGAIIPVKKIGEIVKNQKNPPLFHVDSIQGLGKICTQPGLWQADMASFSGHKLHAPKGTGFLYIKNKNLIAPQIWGGGQEKSMRSGTENVPGLSGLQVALENTTNFKPGNYNQTLADLQEYFITQAKEAIPEIIINTPVDQSAPHLINFSLPGIKGEVMVNALSQKGIYISTGSACSSQNKRLSRVLKAMNLEKNTIEGALRVSFSPQNTRSDIDKMLKACKEEYKFLFND